ncbi:MAG: type I DNA topoisomerase [Flavobacteriales bacterium AspAUS03]
MVKNLVIVESPAKAKTIQGYLGKDFQVASSFGHIADLPEKDMGVDIENDFQPTYVIPKEKKEVVKKLQNLTKQAETVWLATDEDREGEAISWHLYKELKIPDEKLRRIVFHEITKKAIRKAVENPRQINYDLVNAQQARRVLDRLVGFELSPILWRKIKTGLSAGRVQSVAVRLIVEREEEIKRFSTTFYYKVSAIFISKKGQTFKAQLEKSFDTKEEAEVFLKASIDGTFIIDQIEIKLGKKSPPPPFTTSTMQQEASRKLNYSIALTMRLAQQLYEESHITYMRTDSLNLSEEAIDTAQAQIISLYGKEYARPKRYTTKSKSAQEAHEAIRPTDMSKSLTGKDPAQKRLYELIWKRTIAGQMADAILEKTTIHISTPTPYEFIARGEIITFDGFLKMYHESQESEDEKHQKTRLPKLSKGESLQNVEILATQRFTKHPARYSEASLVRTLEELGIGRPSTYVPTISTIQKRNYVEIRDLDGVKRPYEILALKERKIFSIQEKELTGADKKKFFPTDVGVVVNDFLVQYFQQILDYGFTAKVEEDFDEIARGKKTWTKIIRSFYGGFHPKVENVTKNVDRTQGERLLGIDPKSGKKVWAKIGRFGPMIQIGEVNDEKKPRFASLLKHQQINSISLEKALKLFELPRSLGMFEEKEISTNIGRFGPYIKHGSQFFSIKKETGYNPFEITLEQAFNLIRQKREKDEKRSIQCFEDLDPAIEILNGRYGPYIRQGKKNYKIPKNLQPEKLTLENCQQIISESDKKRNKKNHS